MKLGIIQHALSQPFVAATSIAALLHSTWSLSTFMGGLQPVDPLHFVGWLLPGALLAFSLDIGLLWTAASIHRREGGKGMYAAMFTLLLAMFYLQWLYMVSHAPMIDLGPGVRADWKPAIETGRDLAIFVIPALLPLSVAMYTFSRRDESVQPGRQVQPESVTEFRNAAEISPAAVKPELRELPAEVGPEALRNSEGQALIVSEPEREEAASHPFLQQRANGKH